MIGSSEAPYINELARAYGLATDYHAISHPSLPNYLGMIGGSTYGITDDCTSCEASGPNLADQLEQSSLSWRGYMESMPEPCFKGASSGGYAKKHDPFMYFPSITGNETRCKEHVGPLTAFSGDLSAGTLPNFSMIVPNGCHDMHDCSVKQGDDWLRGFLPDLLRAPAYRDGGVVVVTFDEDNGGSNNHVATIVISPRGARGHRSDLRYDHYSLLRGIEDNFGLSHLGHAADKGRRSLFSDFISP